MSNESSFIEWHHSIDKLHGLVSRLNGIGFDAERQVIGGHPYLKARLVKLGETPMANDKVTIFFKVDTKTSIESPWIIARRYVSLANTSSALGDSVTVGWFRPAVVESGARALNPLDL